MQSELGGYIRAKRERRRLSPQALAMRVGYSAKGADKGARRLQQLEREGLEDSKFVERVLDQLGLDPAEAHWLEQADEARRREAWERWANEPIHPFLVIRRGPHWFMHSTREAPQRYTSLVDCERYAGRVIRSLNRIDRHPEPVTARLVWSRRLYVWFDKYGRVKRRESGVYPMETGLPSVEVGNKRIEFRPHTSQ